MARYFVGTSGWNYDSWKNDFYAAQPAGACWLSCCAAEFSTAEMDASFYRLLSDSAGTRLRLRAGPGFRYALKIPRAVTHLRQLNEIEAEISLFWHSAQLFKDRLGMLLLQLSPDLRLDPGWLRAVLQAFADPSRVAVEFHVPLWQNEEIRAALEKVGAACVCIDAPHTITASWVTGKCAYLRLLGRRHWYADRYSYAELEEIGRVAQRMAEHGAEEIYIIFSNNIDGADQANAAALKAILQ
jgi:uncharacterized protein YecE (DUF72 family)